jgi:hypothetical protein
VLSKFAIFFVFAFEVLEPRQWMWEVGVLAEKRAFKDKDTTLNTNAHRASRPKKGFLWFFV